MIMGLLRRPPPTVLFLHVPKTAGTSFRSALASAIAPGKRVWIYPPEDMVGALTPSMLGELSDSDKRRLRLVMGHFHFGLHRSLPQRSHYVTMVREPVARVASLYKHYCQTHPEIVAEMGFEEWVFSGRVLQTDNEMTRLISGRENVHFGECTADLLAEAFDHIRNHFAAVLSMEDITRSAEMFSRLLHVRLPKIPRENVSPEQAVLPELSEVGLRRIAELNRYDAALYDFARRPLRITRLTRTPRLVGVGQVDAA
jgi:hypothetical protein